VAPQAAVPLLNFRLRIDAAEACRAVPLQSVLLRVQLRIEPTRRSYADTSSTGLHDLFGQPAGWGASMRSLLWTHVNLQVPAFTGNTIAVLPVECTYDFNLAATKYFAALSDGDLPLCLLFGGTSFYQTDHGLQAAQISWEREANFRLPASTWHEMMARYYPNRAWLCIDKVAFDRLNGFKSRNSLTSWEQALEKLLSASENELAVEA
jgi:hypothetical protein